MDFSALSKQELNNAFLDANYNYLQAMRNRPLTEVIEDPHFLVIRERLTALTDELHRRKIQRTAKVSDRQ